MTRDEIELLAQAIARCMKSSVWLPGELHQVLDLTSVSVPLGALGYRAGAHGLTARFTVDPGALSIRFIANGGDWWHEVRLPFDFEYPGKPMGQP